MSEGPTRPGKSVLVAYRKILEEIDSFFRSNAAKRPGHPCREGCTACCHGPFDIGPADAWLLVQGLETLEDGERRRALERIAASARRERQSLPDPAIIGLESMGEEAFDAFCDEHLLEPCPLLEEGRCVVWEHRPEPCRLTGARWISGGEILDTDCPIDLTGDWPVVKVDLQPWLARLANIEEGILATSLLQERTTVSLALDFILRHSATDDADS